MLSKPQNREMWMELQHCICRPELDEKPSETSALNLRELSITILLVSNAGSSKM